MSPTTGGLKELHALHLRLHKKKTELDAGPRQIAVREGICKKKQNEIEQQKAKVSELQKTADGKNLQFKTNEQKIIELKAKLNTASSNKEFDIIKGQIEADTAANAVLEDEYLELLEQVDSEKEQITALEGELGEAEKLAKETVNSVKSAEAGIKSSIEELLGEVKTAESCIPSKLSEDYRRLVAAHGPGAIAAAEDGTCTECYTEVSPQMEVELRVGKVIRCRMCARLLYNNNEEE